MVHRNPRQWLEEEQAIAEQIAVNEPIDYFESGNGGAWLLIIAQGIQATQAVCLSATRPVLLTRLETEQG